jgi:hypothetical protein
MKGGALTINSVYRDINAEEAFKIFEQNSTKVFYKLGTTGIIFYREFTGDISHSPFVSLDDPIGSPVKYLLIKYVLHSETYKEFTYTVDNLDETLENIKTITQPQFQNECAIQTNVYNDSIEYIKPVCPFIVSFSTKLATDSSVLDICSRIDYSEHVSTVSIIAMEMPHEIKKIKKTEVGINIFHAMYIFELLRLLFECKIIHGDHHNGNGLMITDKTYFGDDYPYRIVVIDFGRSYKIQCDVTSDQYESVHTDYEYFVILMNFIYDQGYKDDTGEERIKQYRTDSNCNWIKDPLVLINVFPILSTLYINRKRQKQLLKTRYLREIMIYQGFRSSILRNSPDSAQLSIRYLQAIIDSGLKQNIAKTVIDRELNAIAIKSQSLPISETQEGELYNFAGRYNLSVNEMTQKTIELLLISNNIINQEIADLLYAINFLKVRPDLAKGGKIILPNNTSQSLLTINTSSSNKYDKEKQEAEITAKIDEIKQIQATMTDTFADWRNEVYKIYTNPNVEEKNAFYQEQTPFTILTHIMVCSGLFGPLTSGKYIDVKEEENKELYDKLNSIADAFLTMNNGYLSMSNVKTQLMIEDAKKASVGVAVEKVDVQLEGPTVEVTQYGKSLTESIVDQRRVGVEGFGGNKKYSRRKRRRHSKRQKKRCRRKSNKRFYSKKRYSKKRRK